MNPAKRQASYVHAPPAKVGKLTPKEKETGRKLQSMLRGTDCTICMQQLPQACCVISRCDHHFCYPCIGKLILKRKANWYKCPLCRQLLPAKDRRAILEEIDDRLTHRKLRGAPYSRARDAIANLKYLTPLEKESFENKLTRQSAILICKNDGEGDINALHPYRGSYLHCLWMDRASMSSEDVKDIIQYLISNRNIDLDLPGAGGDDTILSVVLRYTRSDPGAIKIVKLLLEGSASPNRKSGGEPYIHMAASETPEAVKLLTDHGAKINVRNRDEQNPLFVCWTPDVADVLLSLPEKINMNEKDINGHTPLSYSASQGNRRMLVYWINKGADRQCKGVAGKCDLLCYLIDSLICDDSKSIEYCRHGLACIGTLLEMEDWNTVYNWQEAFKAFFETLKLSNEYIVKALEKFITAANNAGLDVTNCINTNGLLHKAIITNNYQVCKLLLEANADIYSKDEENNNCLDLVAKHGHNEILYLILKYCPVPELTREMADSYGGH